MYKRQATRSRYRRGSLDELVRVFPEVRGVERHLALECNRDQPFIGDARYIDNEAMRLAISAVAISQT